MEGCRACCPSKGSLQQEAQKGAQGPGELEWPLLLSGKKGCPGVDVLVVVEPEAAAGTVDYGADDLLIVRVGHPGTAGQPPPSASIDAGAAGIRRG